MRLTVLGSGTCELNPQACSSSYFLQAGDLRLMLDLGRGALGRLMQIGVDPHQLSAVLLSHHHLDHMAEMLPLLFSLKYDPAWPPKAELGFMAHEQVAPVMEGLRQVFGEWVESPLWRPHYLKPGQELVWNGLKIHTAPAQHINTSLAYRLQMPKASLVYLGDSAYAPHLADLAHEADLLIAHSAGSEQAPKPKHLYPSAAGRLAREAGVKGLLLSHIYSDVSKEQACRDAAKEFAGPIWAAQDLDSFVLTPGQPPLRQGNALAGQ